MICLYPTANEKLCPEKNLQKFYECKELVGRIASLSRSWLSPTKANASFPWGEDYKGTIRCTKCRIYIFQASTCKKKKKKRNCSLLGRRMHLCRKFDHVWFCPFFLFFFFFSFSLCGKLEAKLFDAWRKACTPKLCTLFCLIRLRSAS